MEQHKIEAWTEPAVWPGFERLFGCLMGARLPAVLDSAGGPAGLAQRSIFACEPFQVLIHAEGRSSVITPDGRARPADDNPFAALRDELRRFHLAPPDDADDAPPAAAAIGFLGYELGRYVERLPATAVRDIALPDMYWAFYDSLLVVDQRTGAAAIYAADVAGRDPRELLRRWQRVLEEAGAEGGVHPQACPASGVAALGGGTHGGKRLGAAPSLESLECNFTRADYCRAVQRTIDYIAAGDIFQANLSQRFTARLDCSAAELYLRLRRANPAPFAAYLAADDSLMAATGSASAQPAQPPPCSTSPWPQAAMPPDSSWPPRLEGVGVSASLRQAGTPPAQTWPQAAMPPGGWAVLSSSPERFLKVVGRRVLTRPIKGTRPRRAGDEVFNNRSCVELLASAKDAAELAMIVDLERNDLGRVCSYGSVRVTEPRTVEEYASVFHTVAQVEGRLHEGHDLVDLLKATFPGGSITGAPKVRAMEIIDELEPTCRSVYTGAIGWLGFDGRMELNIAIRTLLVDGGRVHLQVGGGIVADSRPADEYDETLAKARSLLEALGIAI